MSLFEKEISIEHRSVGLSQRFRAVTPAVALCVLLAGCSQVPDAINPVAWYDAVAGNDEAEATDPANELEAGRTAPPPGSSDGFPNLSRVDQQNAARQGLAADTQSRKYSESVSRQGSSGATDSLYAEDKSPEAPKVEAQQIAPAPQPKVPVTTAAADPAPTPSSDNRVKLTPPARPQAPSATQTAAVPESNDYSVDPAMGQRLAQQLAEIRARAADQGSLLPSNLSTGGQGSPTIVISSGGIETSQPIGGGLSNVVTRGALPGGQVLNNGALPLPSGSTRVATIQFPNGSAALSSHDRKILSDVARLQKQSNGVIRIVGHASLRTRNMDPSQHAITNLKVSEKRANRVANILRQMGVSSNQVLVAAVGDNEPVFLEVMPSGEAGNRRAEIYLTN